MKTEELVSRPDREGWIDALRGFAIILVIIGHASRGNELVKEMIFGFHMPVFFILSGYLFRPEKYANVYDLAKKKFKTYIIPFIALGLVNLIINAASESMTKSGGEWIRSTAMRLLWLIYSWGSASKMPNCSPLWFLPCLFLSSVFFYLFWTCGGFEQRALKKMKIALLCGAVCVFSAFYCAVKDVKHLPWNVDTAVIGAVLMLFGFMCGRENVVERFPAELTYPLMIIGLGVIYKNQGINMNSSNYNNIVLFFVGACATSLALLALFRHTPAGKSRLLQFYGKGTIIVIGFNYAVRSLVNYLWKLQPYISGKLHWAVQSLIITIICGLMMLVWNLLKKRFPQIAIF